MHSAVRSINVVVVSTAPGIRRLRVRRFLILRSRDRDNPTIDVTPALPYPLSTMSTITSRLLSLRSTSAYVAATEDPFLTAAGDRTLARARLADYLFQDRIYAAHAYPRFIGRLIASIPFSITSTPAESNLHEKTLKTLSYALQNVVREVGLFDTLAGRWGLDLGQDADAQGRKLRERKATRDYVAEMARIGAEGDLFCGLVFLWAMEQVCCLSTRNETVL